MNILFCGDIVPGGVLPYQDKYMSNDLMSYIHSFDLRVGTLECAVGTGMKYDESKMCAEKNIVYIRDVDFYRVCEMGFDVVSLANNHIYDLGEQGLVNTMETLRHHNIKYFGAGMNLQEASSPTVIETSEGTIAFLGCCFCGLKPVYVTAATETSSGIWQTDIQTLCNRIKECKVKYDYVVVMPHWGIELKYYPKQEYYQYAHLMIDAGADAVMGSHTHTIGPSWKYKGKFVGYSMGNFLFPDFCMEVPKPTYYPKDVQEYCSLQRQWFYPKDFERPVVSVWRGRNRIGIVYEMHIDRKKIRVRKELVKLNHNNVLARYVGRRAWIVNFRLSVWKFLYTNFSYRTVSRIVYSRINVFNKILNRSKSFNIPVKL